MGTHLRILSERNPMNTNMTIFMAKEISTLEGLTLMKLVTNLANTK